MTQGTLGRSGQWFIRLGLAAAIVAIANGAGAVENAETLEQAFIRVAERVGPAVVSISAEQTERVGIHRGYAFGPYGHGGGDPFDEFFREFFGAVPRQREFRRIGLGSGVIINPDGFILTNEHVVADADRITVTLPDGREFSGVVKGTDPRSDLAVIKIEGEQLPAAPLGDSGQVAVGQWTVAIGNPFGFAVHSPEPTVTVGVVSALHRSLPPTSRRDRYYQDLIQTDAAINPGNSGGPLANIRGEVIGINVAIFTTSGGSQGIGFAIPINAAKRILDDLIAGRQVLYGWLGVQIQDINESLAAYFRLPDQHGVAVVSIVRGSPADQGGLRPGDIIRTFEGQPVKDARTLVQKVSYAAIGERITLGVLREQRELTVTVAIGRRPDEAVVAAADVSLSPQPEAVEWRGMVIGPLTEELGRRLGLAVAVGVVVLNVQPGSAADAAGLAAGDVINEINRQPVRDLETFVTATRRLRGDALVRTDRGFAIVKEP